MTATPRPAVFIHSLFRTGSTYLWSRLRAGSGTQCYYEPFHPQLGFLDLRHPDPWGTDPRGTAESSHPFLERNRFDEYRRLLRPGRRGVPGFEKSFSFTDYCRQDNHPRQQAYINSLIQAAGNKAAVLQFNRSSLRSAWFKRHWPQALHIYLYRNPRHQFISARRQWQLHHQDVFLVTDLLIAGLQHETPQFRALSREVHLQAFPSRVHADEEAAYRAILPAYTEEERYLIFLFLWYTALAENAETADLMINIDRLSAEPEYAAAFTDYLAGRGIEGAAFPDAHVAQYDDIPLTQAHAAECRARNLAYSRFPVSSLKNRLKKIEARTREFLDVPIDPDENAPARPGHTLSVRERLDRSRDMAFCLQAAMAGVRPNLEKPPGNAAAQLESESATTRRMVRIPPTSPPATICGGLRLNGFGKRKTAELPLVTVITVVRNERLALADTLAGIWDQSYANLELVVVDGASNDGTSDYLKSVEDRIDLWISEPDNGIFDAMNKGVRLASGDWVIFLNAGDAFYLPVTVEKVIRRIPPHAELVYGDTYFLGGDFSGNVPAWPLTQLWKTMVFTHQSLFTRRDYLLSHPFDLRYRICADFHLVFNAYMDKRSFFYSHETIACFSPGFSETSRARMAWEKWRIVRKRRNRPRVHLFYIRLIVRRWLSDMRKRSLKKKT
ncbi:MAG: glycosyltransferase family 2 protein [Acidobacteriota bacterium]|jgi:hypothetical protein|nr:glycosyltransferase family 2 protein [Acidobacteriota bacterium]